MIQVTVASTTNRNTVILPATTTLRAAFEQQGIDYSRGITTLDGSPIAAGGLDKSFADYGITDRCTLVNIVKADNA